jgi:sugar fermentation stimulation protein A
VALDGRLVEAHVPNPGRMEELFTPRRSVWLAERREPGRRTGYDLLLVRTRRGYVSLDSRLPPRLLEEALCAGYAPGFGPITGIEREVTRGASRFDLLLHEGEGTTLVEVKSCTLVVRGSALFPDAPTVRGARHARHLAAIAREGGSTAIVFVIQRADAARFSPNDRTDPDFGQALREAAATGVALRAYACEVSRRMIAIAREVPVVS